MRLFAIKQSYIVNSVLFVSFLCILSLGLVGGCSDGGGQNESQALTENDFAEDSALRAELDEGVLVTFLESPMSEEEEQEEDTGTRGKDDIPVRYDETTEQTFCWEDEDPNAMHFMELRDLEGNLILKLEVNGDCVTQEIEAGDYVVSIYHDGTVGDPLSIFLIPDPEELEEFDESEQTRNTEGFLEIVNVAATKILETIHKTVTKDAIAQTRDQNRQTLLSTNRCSGCNLHGANLNGANLKSARLIDARLFNARFIRADLSGAGLIRADLTGAVMSSAILRTARLNAAYLSDAILTNVDTRSANFNGATWCDGMCICAAGESGSCVRCPPIDTCTVF